MTIRNKLTNELLSQELVAFINLFNSNQESKSYFSENIKTFSKIKERLDLHKIEVAIVGITSSGKSTMLNSILGEKLLPEKVKPSSGIQVICEYGKELKAIICFKSELNKKDEIVIKNISEKIENYGDETKNPKNEKGVDEIRLYSPHFRLNKSIVLVDTPGLDAYELESHEKITLQLVLPTVQMILFLTTVKSSSDSKNLEIIDQVTTDNKPLVVVQNMVDSICPKESTEGILKTSQEIQKEHYQRVYKLIQNAQKKSVRYAPIVQISALKAKKDWINSGMDNLEKTLSKLVEKTEPRRLFLFVNQINNELKNIKQGLDINNDKNKSYENNLKNIDIMCENLIQFENNFKIVTNNFDRNVNLISNELNKLLLDIYNQYPKDPEQDDFIHQIKLSNLTQKMSETNNDLLHFIEKGQKKLDLICTNQNLQIHDIVERQKLEFFSTSITTELYNDIKIGKRPPTKKPGLWNWVKGFWGNSETEEKEYNINISVVNIKKLISDLSKKSDDWQSFVEKNLEKFSKSIKYSLNVLKSDLDSKRLNEEKKLKQTIDSKLGIKIITSVSKFSENFKVSDFIEDDELVESNNKYFNESKIENVSELSLNLFNLAHQYSFSRLYEIRNHIIEKSNKNKNIVIWGWDNIHINRFINYYFSDLTDYDIEENESVRVIYKKNNKISSITIVNEARLDNKNFEFPKDCLLFIIINTIQQGSTSTKLSKSLIKQKNISNNIVWVMDSVTEFLNNDNLIEGFNAFRNIIKHSGKNISEVMASDKDIYYTVLLHELYFNQSELESKNYQMQLINDMKNCFKLDNNSTNKLGSYIDQWRSYAQRN